MFVKKIIIIFSLFNFLGGNITKYKVFLHVSLSFFLILFPFILFF